MAFAVGELGLRLEEFYDMPWCEFVIKSFAYYRMKNDDWERTRILAYHSLIGSHFDPKKLPKYDVFLKAKKKSVISDEARNLFNQRMKEWELLKSK